MDHDPVVVDFLFRLPASPPPASGVSTWKVLASRLGSSELPSLQRSAASFVEDRQVEFVALSRKLESLTQACSASALFPQVHEGLDCPSVPPSLRDCRTVELQERVSEFHSQLQSLLLAGLPSPAPESCSRVWRAHDAWDRCVSLLCRMRTYLNGLNLSGRGSSVDSAKVCLQELRRCWTKATDMQLHLAGKKSGAFVRSGASVSCNWDGFYTSVVGWVRQLGFSLEVAQCCLSSLSPAPESGQASAVRAVDLAWPDGGVSLLNLSRCLSLLSSWLTVARSSLAATLLLHSSQVRDSRVSLLRSGAVALWAKRMRPAGFSKSYYPTVVSDSGSSRPPTSVADHLLGARQEWSRVLQEPRVPWSSDLVDSWVDSLGLRRGTFSWTQAAQLPPDSLAFRVARAYSAPGPWRLHCWQGSDVSVVSATQVRVGQWLYSVFQGHWLARRPGPVCGPSHLVLQVGGCPSSDWSLDRWFWVSTRRGFSSHSVIRVQSMATQAAVAPLLFSERVDLLRRLRGSRPGPSGFKLEFLGLFPLWVQELFWSSLDLQRSSGTVASCLKTALQVHLPKSDGGWRPLSMLEEGFKAVEGPVTRRLNRQFDPWEPSRSPFSSVNLAFQRGVSAASEVLYLDVLLCEDAHLHSLPFCRVPADYEKFFNTLQLASVDAIHECRGLPDAARRLYQSAFQGVHMCISTGVGSSEPVLVTRGCPQGAVSSPALSRAAQEPILRLRESSSASYRTSSGRRVACVGYADDVEHYGSGLRDLPAILAELGAGSQATGIGFSWRKFWAFCSDWDSALPLLSPAAAAVVSADGAQVVSWDIWAGGAQQAFLPRGREDREERLLGKRGFVFNRHEPAAADLLEKFASARRRLAYKRCSWEECVALYQWIMRGVAGYAPLVGIPHPLQLHAEDAAFQRLLLSVIGVRSTAERVSLVAAQQVGGLGAPSVVEAVAASCASDLITLLSGVSTASGVARDALRYAMSLPPDRVEAWDGLVLRGMRFLSGYGFYITVSTDRLVGRVLDVLASASPPPQPLIGPFDGDSFLAAQRFCRVGVLANTIRTALVAFRGAALPMAHWDDPAHWVGHVSAACSFSALDVASAVGQCLQADSVEWRAECAMFRPRVLPPVIPMDWPVTAWDDPWSEAADPRSQFLDEAHASFTQDFGIYGDGGALSCGHASFSAQARAFGQADRYWDDSGEVSSAVASRLPVQYGSVVSTVHVAELFSLLVGLRWCRADAWNLLVFDRSALFSVLQVCAQGSLHQLLLLSCAPVVARLRRRVQSLVRAWTGAASEPVWRLHQSAYPDHWHRAFPVDGKLRRMSSLSLNVSGLVGVDIKSHQTGCALPFPALVAGNEAQDSACSSVMSQPAPVNLPYPTGGFFCFLSVSGSMVAVPPREVFRQTLRAQAEQLWAKRRVQGKVASLAHQVFGEVLFPGWYVDFVPPPAWRSWCLPTDGRSLDLSGMLYRCVRAIGGGWTEQLHVDPALVEVAERWCQARGLESKRTCPLCRAGPGTPRHVVMSCSAMRPLVDQWRDALEAELRSLCGEELLLARASSWRAEVGRQGRSHELGSIDIGAARRWPCLTAWRFAVPIPQREPILSSDVNSSSQSAVAAELPFDLAYRAVMCADLGRVLCQHSSVVDVGGASESFSTIHQPGDVQTDLRHMAQRKTRFLPAVRFTSLLVLGLRRIRVEYAKRLAAWRTCASVFVPAVPDSPSLPGVARSMSAFAAWLASRSGLMCVRELRWLLPSVSLVESRLQREVVGFRSLSAAHLVALHAAGVPVLLDGDPSWGPDLPPWDEAYAVLATRCVCTVRVGPVSPLELCSHCARARVANACDPASALNCPWCRQRHGEVCRLCSRLVHFRGQCAWNRGAHRAYGGSPHTGVLLCPDCAWSWVCMLRDSLRRPCLSRPSGELARHVSHLQSIVAPGAGDSVVRPRPAVRVAKVRRWFLVQLRDCPQERSVLFRLCCDAFPDVSNGTLAPIFDHVVQILSREGLLSSSLRGGRLFLSSAR